MIVHGPGFHTPTSNGWARFALPCCDKPVSAARPGIVTSDPSLVTCTDGLPRLVHDGKIVALCGQCHEPLVSREVDDGRIWACERHGDVVVQLRHYDLDLDLVRRQMVNNPDIDFRVFAEVFHGTAFVGIDP